LFTVRPRGVIANKEGQRASLGGSVRKRWSVAELPTCRFRGGDCGFPTDQPLGTARALIGHQKEEERGRRRGALTF